MSTTQFNLVYIVSAIAALGTAHLINSTSSSVPLVVKFFIVPLLVAYITIAILNYLFPKLNVSGARMVNYTDNTILGAINNTGYYEIFPPLLAVAVVFIILLYFKTI